MGKLFDSKCCTNNVDISTQHTICDSWRCQLRLSTTSQYVWAYCRSRIIYYWCMHIEIFVIKNLLIYLSCATSYLTDNSNYGITLKPWEKYEKYYSRIRSITTSQGTDKSLLLKAIYRYTVVIININEGLGNTLGVYLLYLVSL